MRGTQGPQIHDTDNEIDSQTREKSNTGEAPPLKEKAQSLAPGRNRANIFIGLGSPELIPSRVLTPHTAARQERLRCGSHPVCLRATCAFPR